MDDLKGYILDKAQVKFDRFGLKKTTMDDISRECKISKKTLYKHFVSKEDLFISLFARETRRGREIIFARMGDISDPMERLIQLTKTAIGYFNEDHFLTRILKDDQALFSAFLGAKYHSMLEQEIIAVIADIIREGKGKGQFRDVDEAVMAYAGIKLFQAFSYMRTTEFLPEKLAQGYYTEALVDLFVHALQKRPTEKGAVSG